MHCYITYCTIFYIQQEPKFSSLEKASEIFCQSFNRGHLSEVKGVEGRHSSLWFGLSLLSFLYLKDSCSCYPSVKD